jgi:hypothetical protein
MVNIYRYCVYFNNGRISNKVYPYFLLTFNYQEIYILWYVTVGYKLNFIYVLSSCFNTLRTGDANLRLLRFCITSVKVRWRKFAF